MHTSISRSQAALAAAFSLPLGLFAGYIAYAARYRLSRRHLFAGTFACQLERSLLCASRIAMHAAWRMAKNHDGHYWIPVKRCGGPLSEAAGLRVSCFLTRTSSKAA